MDEIRGIGKIVQYDIERLKNNEIYSCIERDINNFPVKLNGYNILDPSIVLMDGNLISYEKDYQETDETNRVVINRQLTGSLGDPEPNFYEYGDGINWNSRVDVIKLKPVIVIIHWSSFEK
jgi:hypothetical protein